jgi:hypothetical protein
MMDRGSKDRSPLTFILMVFLVSIPFYWFNDRSVLPKSFHMHAPTFIFTAIIPISSANLFLYRERGGTESGNCGETSSTPGGSETNSGTSRYSC